MAKDRNIQFRAFFCLLGILYSFLECEGFSILYVAHAGKNSKARSCSAILKSARTLNLSDLRPEILYTTGAGKGFKVSVAIFASSGGGV